ncbi:MAG: hypothetical protein Q8N23_20850 [Archangium sp.]|nr:hypothetical protein [Archangium sp.]MDP3573347.1 hypothetical protein [Archangium sp.]
MRLTPRLALFVGVVVVLSWVSCGGTSVDGAVGPTGGDVCLPDNKVCISVPIGGLETQEILRIAPGADVPGGALSDGYDISGVGSAPIVFVKPATVSFSLELVRAGTLENENLLRIYTRERLESGELGEWQPLENAFVDRVRNVVRGDTRHLSPFAVLRSDRLVDGGDPFEIDGGSRDGSVIVVPPFDGGRPDAGRPDAGRDAGVPDSGTPDAGRDAGPPDSGTPDAGTPDAGFDAGVDAGFDAGVDAGVDAGLDAGVDAGVDAGIDAGADAGSDAGSVDAGEDAGVDAG